MDNFYDLFKHTTPTVNLDPASLFTNNHDLTRGGTDYGLAALKDEANRLAATPEGGRNDQLNRAMFSLAQLVQGGELDGQLVTDTLTDAARQAGLTDTEINRTLNSAARAGQQNPRQAPDLADSLGLNPATILDTTPPAPTMPAPATNTPPTQPDAVTQQGEDKDPETLLATQILEHLPILDWEELWADNSEEEWILYPLVAKRRGIVIYSAPKVGKSLLMLELAAHIAEGSSFLGATVDAPHNVLYVDFENDPKGDIRPRLQQMGYTPGRLKNLKYLSFPTMAGLDTEKGANQLLAACHVYKCDVVVIDTISRAVQGEENENDTWLAFYRQTGLKLKQAGITMIRLDHTGKDESKGQRGGSAKSGDVDAIWRLKKITDDGNMLDLSLEDARLPIGERQLILERVSEEAPLHRVKGAGPMAAWDAKVGELVAFLDTVETPKELSKRTAREILKEHGKSASNEVLNEVVRRIKARLPELTVLGGEGENQ